MALVQGIAPWYEKLGMLKLTTDIDVFGNENSYISWGNSLITPKFDFPIGNTTTRYIELIEGVFYFYLKGDINSETKEMNYYRLQFPSSGKYYKYGIYASSNSDNLRLLIEGMSTSSESSSHVAKVEIVFFSSGDIQIKSSISGQIKLYYSGTEGTTSMYLNSGHCGYIQKQGSEYTILTDYYDDSAGSPASKIIDTIIMKSGKGKKLVNVYSVDFTDIYNSSKCLRIKTDKGVGYLKYAELDQEANSALRGNLLDGSYKILDVTDTLSTDTYDEWRTLLSFSTYFSSLETVRLNTVYIGSSKYYWDTVIKYSWEGTPIADTVKHIISRVYNYKCSDQSGENIVSSTMYMKYYYGDSSSSSFISCGTSQNSKDGIYNLGNNSVEYSGYSINNMTGFIIDVDSSSASSYYHIPNSGARIYLKTQSCHEVV